MSDLTPIPTEQRRAYYDALLAGRDEAARLGYGLMDDRVFAAFHRALYGPMLDAHEAEVRAKVAEEIAALVTDLTWNDGYTTAVRDAAAIARQHAANGPRIAVERRTAPPEGSANHDGSERHSGAQEAQKPCGCVGKCPPIFKPCPVCQGEVRSVAVDGELTTTYRPCGHTVADTKEN